MEKTHKTKKSNPPTLPIRIKAPSEDDDDRSVIYYDEDDANAILLQQDPFSLDAIRCAPATQQQPETEPDKPKSQKRSVKSKKSMHRRERSGLTPLRTGEQGSQSSYRTFGSSASNHHSRTSATTTSSSGHTKGLSLGGSEKTISWGGFLQFRNLERTTWFSGCLCLPFTKIGIYTKPGIWKEKGFYYVDGGALKKRGRASTKSFLTGTPSDSGETVLSFDNIERVEKAARGRTLLIFMKSRDNPVNPNQRIGGEVFEFRSHSERELKQLKRILRKFASARPRMTRKPSKVVMKIKQGIQPSKFPLLKVESDPI